MVTSLNSAPQSTQTIWVFRLQMLRVYIKMRGNGKCMQSQWHLPPHCAYSL